MYTGNDPFNQKLHEFLEQSKGSKYDKSAIIYNLICESENPKGAFQYFCENANYIDSSEEKEIEEYFTAQQLNKFHQTYSSLVDALLTKLVERRYEKEKFYSELWEGIFNSDVLFDDKDSKIYAVGRIWADPRIPYFCVNEGVKMSNEEFAEILDANKELLKEASFILNCKYEQKTELASRLLDLLDQCGEYRVKTVLMAKIIDSTEKKLMLRMLKNN